MIDVLVFCMAVAVGLAVLLWLLSRLWGSVLVCALVAISTAHTAINVHWLWVLFHVPLFLFSLVAASDQAKDQAARAR